jgi:hypothetical protein
MARDFWRGLAQILIDAADVDIRTFQSKLVSSVRNRPAGRNLAFWAQDNPAGFEVLVHGLSIAAKQLGRNIRNKGMVSELLADQLSHLPYEFRQAFTGRDVGRLNQEMISAAEIEPEAEELIESRAKRAFRPSQNEFEPQQMLAQVQAGILTLIQGSREQGAFMGTLAREMIDALGCPEELTKFRDHFLKEKLIARSVLQPGVGKLTEVEKERMLAWMKERIGEPEITLEEAKEWSVNPLSVEFRRLRAEAFLAALDKSPTENVQLTDDSVIGVIISGTFAVASHSRLEELKELAEYKNRIPSLRTKWIGEGRPMQWFKALDLIEHEISKLT